jgi:hypothetical protein
MTVLDDKIIAGLMAITDFKLAPEMVKDVSQFCDYMVLRYDKNTRNKKIFNKCVKVAEKNNRFVIAYSEGGDYNEWNWRESLVRKLDVTKPDYVIFLDQDEKLEEGFAEIDLEDWQHSTATRMEFMYEMVTKDGVEVPVYPYRRHCKVFKWHPGINYQPYQCFARPNMKDEGAFLAKTRIKHYCFFDKECRRGKMLQGDIKYKGEVICDTCGKKLLDVIPELDNE